MDNMKIQESAEDYLENILILSTAQQRVRSIDIVKKMKLSKPSVSVAMKKLRENGYINMDSDGYITLADEGRKIAEKIYERHVFISQWLEDLGVQKDIAMNDACRIEHVLSDETFNAIKKKYGGGICKDCDGCN
jgi:Mn-dependent DtxR family transcriptional regulator